MADQASRFELAAHHALPAVSCPRPVRLISMATVGSPQGWFVFHIHVHDDIPRDQATWVARRFDWWLEEMRDLLPHGTGLQLRILRDEKGVSDIDYVSEEDGYSSKGLDAFKAAVAGQAPCNAGMPMSRNYHLLLTARKPYPKMLGLASRRVAIASMIHSRTPGHELGHMLKATHADGAVELLRDGAYRCATAMREGNPQRKYPDCERFSAANRENIRRELASIWTKAKATLGKEGS